jgi:hypothetical protein
VTSAPRSEATVGQPSRATRPRRRHGHHRHDRQQCAGQRQRQRPTRRLLVERLEQPAGRAARRSPDGDAHAPAGAPVPRRAPGVLARDRAREKPIARCTPMAGRRRWTSAAVVAASIVAAAPGR